MTVHVHPRAGESGSRDLRPFIRRPLRERLRAPFWSLLVTGVLVFALARFGFFSEQFVNGFAKLGHALVMMLQPSGVEYLPEFLVALGETLAMAFLGTLLAAVLAFPAALLASREINRFGWLQFGARRFADSLRCLDYLIWALIFVRVVGLGPMAGILAIAVVDLGTFAKLYSEALDNISRKPVEGLRAAGGGWFSELRFGVLPQVLPVMLANTLYMWESNTRSATILGIVGAGGIGYYLADRLRVLEWGQASLIIILIIFAVFLIDRISHRLRMALIRGKAGASR